MGGQTRFTDVRLRSRGQSRSLLMRRGSRHDVVALSIGKATATALPRRGHGRRGAQIHRLLLLLVFFLLVLLGLHDGLQQLAHALHGAVLLLAAGVSLRLLLLLRSLKVAIGLLTSRLGSLRPLLETDSPTFGVLSFSLALESSFHMLCGLSHRLRSTGLNLLASIVNLFRGLTGGLARRQLFFALLRKPTRSSRVTICCLLGPSGRFIGSSLPSERSPDSLDRITRGDRRCIFAASLFRRLFVLTQTGPMSSIEGSSVTGVCRRPLRRRESTHRLGRALTLGLFLTLTPLRLLRISLLALLLTRLLRPLLPASPLLSGRLRLLRLLPPLPLSLICGNRDRAARGAAVLLPTSDNLISTSQFLLFVRVPTTKLLGQSQ